MARRTIQECDLYKTEFDQDETVTIVIRAKGKRKGQSYDLCPEAAEALQQALVSRTAHRIVPMTQETQRSQGQSKRMLEEVFGNDPVDDDVFIDRKMVERGDETPPSESEDVEVEFESEREVVGGSKSKDEKCMHPNKTPPRERIVKGRKGYWHVCKDCGAKIKPTTAKYRAEYNRQRPPKGVNVGTHAAEDRKRD